MTRGYRLTNYFAAVLKSNQVHYLSEYECKEILEYSSVYFTGGKSDKNLATLDNATNNHGYDDERGDYQVVIHDHLAYRYEVVDTHSTDDVRPMPYERWWFP